MSLLRLLTTGKHLVGVKETERRYRLTSQRLLPQFGPARNPFRDRGKPDPVQAEACSLENPAGNNASGHKRVIPLADGKPTPALQGLAVNRALSASARGTWLAEALRLRAAALLGKWRTRLSRWPGRPRGKAGKPAILRSTKPTAQEDLSLHKIKVVRNDLSDADLEVVLAKQPAAQASATPGVQAEERAGVGEGNWGRATTRMFGPGKT